METNIRQSIVTALDTLFKTIKTTASYETNLGSNVHWWRGEAVEVSELPALLCRDTVQTIPQTGGGQEHTMFLTVEIYCTASDAGVVMRKCIADVIKAIGTSLTLGGLVADIQTGGSGESTYVDHEGRKVFVTSLVFQVLYETLNWNPYS